MPPQARDPRESSSEVDLEHRLDEERRIFFSGPVVVFQWRNAPGWPVEYVSPNVSEVFGYTAEDFLRGRVAYAELIEPEDLDRVAREVRDATESGRDRFVHASYRFRRKSGEVAWLDDYTTILRGADGAAEHYLGYVIDVTERKLAEEESEKLRAQLLHAQKLESLGLLAGGVAHDFNNLLSGVIGYADLAGEAETVEEARPLIEKIKTSAERAAELSQQMLAYSGRGRLAVGAHDLNALIEEMADLLAVSISKRIELRYELAPGLPPIQADATQMRQLLMNLITNASEAIGDRAGVIRLETGREGDRVVARVSDDGCGMDAETRERLFDPFFSTKFEGRGLGLAAVLGILRGHGGSIDVRSEPGRGTTIEVSLPISAQAVPRRAPPPPIDTAWRGRGTALVVDDEEIIRLLAEHALRRAGFAVRTATNGEEGLAAFRGHAGEIAVVLLDLTMPGLGGAEVYRELVGLRPDLPIVITSGFEREDVAAKFAADPRPAFLMKPFQARQLLAAVRSAMEARAPGRPA